MSDIEDLAAYTLADVEPVVDASASPRRRMNGLKQTKKMMERGVRTIRQSEHFSSSTAPVTLPRLKFLEGDSK